MLMEHFLSEIEHTLNLLTKKCATQSANSNLWVLLINAVSNGNRTEWSPIRSVIIRVINKIGRPRSGSPICLIKNCPIKAEIRAVYSQSDLRIFL